MIRSIVKIARRLGRLGRIPTPTWLVRVRIENGLESSKIVLQNVFKIPLGSIEIISQYHNFMSDEINKN
ncbi:hypothetical protein BpHYR1_000234 [Brachionus plicatilis]|uniref:Uncharacterized protein n=1 Tax=Brachionus plicatilis TaxID=10195 RepID=A0A3M7PEP6_BRAPC|nr:hypothetical protein BpHYR1_000234 [Brachionus plicatilis]